MSPRSVTIDVNKSQVASAFDPEERFFGEQLDSARTLIRRRLGAVHEGSRKSNRESKYCPPIAIFGTRGAGKSSFLLTLSKEIEEKESSIRVLETLEPSRIETHEIPLVTVVAAILREVGKRAKDRLDGELEGLDQSYQELARGFGVLIQNQDLVQRDRSESAATFAQRVFDDSHSGLALRERFRTFVEKAAKFCSISTFLLCIDDVDVAHKRWSDVLETVRKYLDVPQLVVVIAADDDLLDVHLTRCAHEWLGPLVDRDVRGSNLERKRAERNVRRYNAQAYLLKEQYFTKTLPPDHRIYLKPLAIQIREKEVDVRLKLVSQEESDESAIVKLADCLAPLGELLGGDWRLAAEYLPSKNRSLVRLLPTLLNWRGPEEPERREEKPLAQHLGDHPLDEILRMNRRALVAAGVRGWTLRRLGDGEGDEALMRWVIHHAVETPRSFNLKGDSSPDGDERRLVPALLYACWVRGCQQRKRGNALLSYGLRIVLPAYTVERSRRRQRVADELDYSLKHGSQQDCVATVGRLLAWQENRAQVARRAKPVPMLGRIENSASKVYATIGNKKNSFFMGLARIADLCATWSSKLSDVIDGDECAEQIAKHTDTESWQWIDWLKANQELSKKALRAETIGELFAFMYSQCCEGILEASEKAYVYTFLYALGAGELGTKHRGRFGGEYLPVEEEDVQRLLDRPNLSTEAPFFNVWRSCPLFIQHLPGGATLGG